MFELLFAEIEAKITKIHRVVGPFVAFPVTQIDFPHLYTGAFNSFKIIFKYVF